MRIAVFTAQSDFEQTPWWQILVEHPEVESILLCRQILRLTPRQALRRFRRNVARHGLLFIPYRAALFALQLVRSLRSDHSPAPAVPSVPVEEASGQNLHDEEMLRRIRAFDPDLGVSIGAPILRPTLFRIPRRGTINLHLGKVPDFRGAPPGFWELVNRANSIGATVHWMDEGLDTGAVISESEAPLYAGDSLTDVTARATELGIHVLTEALEAVSRGAASGRPQPSSGRTNRFPTLGQRMTLSWDLTIQRLRHRLTARQVAKEVTMTFALFFYRPLRDVIRTIRRRHPVRIFTFHRVTSLCRDGMTVSPTQFTRQIDYLARHHEIVTLERGIDLIRSGARLSRPVAVLTFDDAYRTVYTAAWPTLSRRRLPAACFISTELVSTDRRFDHDSESPVKPFLDVMSWSELAALRAAGWSVGAHTANHVRLSACDLQQLDHEIREPRRALLVHLRSEADVLAFPFGNAEDISTEALQLARLVGHKTVLADYGGENRTGSSSFVLGRFDIGGDHQTLAWKAMAHGLDASPWRHLWPA